MRLLLLAILLTLMLAACDDKPANPGTYPCHSNIAPCTTETP